MKKVTTKDIIQRLISIHGNKYDYSKVDYKNSNSKIILVCPKHGEFQIYPKHINEGRGCQKCSKHTITTEEFIEKAQQIHNNKYNYSNIKYTGSHDKIKIICPIHGEFEQEARKHLDGHGCPKCGFENTKNKQSYSTQKFVELSNKVHNNKYNYSKVNYINNKTKVEIICPKHGSFYQVPYSHLSGEGCPKCKASKGENQIELFLKENNINYVSQYEVPIDFDINSSKITKIDFYLPDYNLFIEYNGKQHYIPVEYFGGQLTFEHQQKRDNYVRKYCKTNNIKLLEIKYDDNIKNKLYEVLNVDNLQSINCL